MKNIYIKDAVLLIILCVLTSIIYAQEETGYSNYSGVNGVFANPADAVGSRYRFHANLFSIGVNATNNMYELNSKKLFSFDYSGIKEGTDYNKIDGSQKKFLAANLDAKGPSVLFNINKKSALAITTRVRSMVNENGLSNNVFNLIGQADEAYYGKDYSEQKVHFGLHSFADIGVTYSRLLIDQPTKRLKLGATLKYVYGVGSGSVYVERFSVVNVKNADTIAKINGLFNVNYSKNASGLLNGDFTSVFSQFGDAAGASGLGTDLGLVYEIKQASNPNSYQWRFGLSITDITLKKLQYNNGSQNGKYNIDSINVLSDAFTIKKGESYSDYLYRLQNQTYIIKRKADSTFKIALPTALHANIDWHFKKHLFLNAGLLLNVIKTEKADASTNYVTTLLLAPRYERKWVTVSMPLSLLANQIFNWGVGVYVGPLYIGSSSLFSNLLKSKVNTTDFRMSLSVPIYRKK